MAEACIEEVVIDDEGSKLTDEDRLMRQARVHARERLAHEDLKVPVQRFKTLFLGLKMNHRNRTELVHPLMFLVRRIVYAATVVAVPDGSLAPIF